MTVVVTFERPSKPCRMNRGVGALTRKEGSGVELPDCTQATTVYDTHPTTERAPASVTNLETRRNAA